MSDLDTLGRRYARRVHLALAEVELPPVDSLERRLDRARGTGWSRGVWVAVVAAAAVIALATPVILLTTRNGASTEEPVTTTPAVTGSTIQGLDEVPESCPVTVPGVDAFTPAEATPDDPPSVYDVVWFGTPDLWTIVNQKGEVWRDLPRGANGTLTERTFWWSENYSADNPGEITLTAEQIGGAGLRYENSRRAGAGFSPFMTQPTHESVTVMGLALPDPGCWRVTASYKGATLSYVVWVEDGEQLEYETYIDGGNVWIVSDCPNTDQVLAGHPDGLPYAGEIQTREEIESWYGTGDNHRVIRRNGEAWDRDADGVVYTVWVEDFMIEVTLEDASQCPAMPTMNNGVPVIYRLPDQPEG